MSTQGQSNIVDRFQRHASLFAALGDEVRLKLLTKLSQDKALSITQLAKDSTITRQAITKHLRVLQTVGLIRGTRYGRENLYSLQIKPFKDAEEALKNISEQWDTALERLKSFLEE